MGWVQVSGSVFGCCDKAGLCFFRGLLPLFAHLRLWHGQAAVMRG